MIASKFNIPLVFYGENQAEYGNSKEENKTSLMSDKFFSQKEISDIKIGGKSIRSILKDTKFKINEFQPYLPIDTYEIKNKKIEQRFLGYFLKWDPQECFYYAVQNTGFKTNSERTEGSYSKYSSIDDKIDPFHYYCTYIKFGIGRTTYDAAQEIRNQKISREEGVALVNKYDDEFPKKYFKEFLNYLDIDEKTFWSTVDHFRSPHLWTRKNNKWFLNKKIL